MIPVVLIAYRRADLLTRTMAALRADGVTRIVAFCDGPRDATEEDGVRRVRELLRGTDWCDLVLHERADNAGLGRSVVAGVTQALQDDESVIVVEDDLVWSPGTYSYLSAALTHYADEPQVMSVNAWTHPRITPPGIGTAPYFDGRAGCWGWGTNRRAWEGMDRPPVEIVRECVRRGVDPTRYGSDLPALAEFALRNNLWAVFWWYHHMARDGVSLRPPYSLVEHLGWDPRATTATGAARTWQNPPLRPCPPVPDVWPTPVADQRCAALWRAATRDDRSAA